MKYNYNYYYFPHRPKKVRQYGIKNIDIVINDLLMIFHYYIIKTN